MTTCNRTFIQSLFSTEEMSFGFVNLIRFVMMHFLWAVCRDGCRMDNVQKNVGCRKFAFSGVQLLSFPKLYRPPNGSFR